MIFGARFFVGESVSVMTKSTGTQMSSHTPMLAGVFTTFGIGIGITTAFAAFLAGVVVLIAILTLVTHFNAFMSWIRSRRLTPAE